MRFNTCVHAAEIAERIKDDSRMKIIVALMLATSCSWTLTDKLPDTYEPRSNIAPRCDTGRGPMVLDIIMSTASVISSSVELADSRQSVKNAGFVDLGVGLLFAVSAASGASWTSRCRQAVDEYEASPPSAPTEAPEALELRRLRAEKAARDAEDLKRLRAEHNAMVDAGVVVDGASD